MGYDIVVEPPELPPPTTTQAEDIDRKIYMEEIETSKSSIDSSQQKQAESIGGQVEEGRPGSAEEIRRRKETEALGSGDATRTELEEKRRRWLEERLNYETTCNSRDSEYNPPSHTMTPEELENHRRFALVFYNRQIEELMSRVQELQAGDAPAQYSIYGPEWEELSNLVRERDGNRCRRCGLS
jgi:hypothetical protein